LKRAIIFGAGGQDGHYLKQLLAREGVAVYAYSRIQCNVVSQTHVRSIVRMAEPDYVFHFAAESSTKHEDWYRNQAAIVDGALHILEAVKDHAPNCKVYLAGSILQFQEQHDVSLTSTPSNNTIYAAQRNAMVGYARYYRSTGIQVYVGYFSHHDSPLRKPHHLAKKLAEEARLVAKGLSPHMRVMNPDDEKEWNFAGDMMQAVWEQVNSPIYEAVLGSGVTRSVGDYAKACMDVLIIDALIPEEESWAKVYAEYSREYHTKCCTSYSSFSHCFKTTLPQLAEMMVTG